jgi:hypothetical protein
MDCAKNDPGEGVGPKKALKRLISKLFSTI